MMIHPINLSRQVKRNLPRCAHVGHSVPYPPMDTSLTSYVAALSSVVDTLERHPSVTWTIVVLLVMLGTPDIGPRDKPWIVRRDGLASGLIQGVKAYAERTAVFKGLEEEIAFFRAEFKGLKDRVGETEKVVSWQTQVLMAISSALKIDVLALLHRRESESPVSTTAVSAISGIGSPSVPKDVAPDVIGKQPEQGRQSAPTCGRLPLDTI